MKVAHLFAAGILMVCATLGWADTITMKDGRVIAGTYVGGTARQIRVDLGPEVRTFDISEVARIEFSNSDTAGGTITPPPPRPVQNQDPDRPILRRSPDSADPSQPTAPASINTSADNDRPTLHRTDDGGSRSDSGQAPQATTPVTIASGTDVVVRLIDAVDSTTASQGQRFAASLDQPVEVNGRTVIPRGANAVLELVEAQSSGKFTGRTELALALISVKVNDKYVPVNTQTVTRVSDPRGQQTAKVVGGAAAVGAIIGAVAGGGKGAAIGAGAGGAAGAGAQAVTKGQKVKIASETRLTFVLENPVTI